MTSSFKDSPEVMEFMTLFTRLKDWSDDTHQDLADFAKTDGSIKELCIQLSWAASFLKMNERRRRELFTGPVDPKFLEAWRDFEDRYEAVVSRVVAR